ncbi:MAG: glycosyltransferase family 9 protein [Elusimicrobiota bacterium]|jgi:heptosyltransferase-2|nr:glycosyltransferase family 9 protein [Elusimicrobiota bacterium]
MNKILVVSNGNIGDFIMQTGALKLLRENCPKDRIVLIASVKTKEFAERLNFYDKVFYTDFSFSGGKIKQIFDRLFWLFRNYFKIKRERFDDCIFLDHSRFFARAFPLFKIKNFIGPSTWWCGNNIKNPNVSRLTHIVELPANSDEVHLTNRYQAIVRNYCGSFNSAKPYLAPSSKETLQRVETLLQKTNRHSIVLSLRGDNIKGNQKIYPRQHCIEFIKLLSKEGDFDFYFAGTKDFYNYADFVKKELKGLNIVNLCSKTSLLDLKALFEKIDLAISVDTGAIHIAAEAGAKIIGLFGANPKNSIPVSHQTEILYVKEPCSPCHYSRTVLKIPCPFGDNPKCLEDITPKMIVEAVKRLIKL